MLRFSVIKPAPERFITPLVASLQLAGLQVYDPTERLKRAKSKGLLYYRTDTHWNALGAAEAFEGFLSYMGLPPLPSLKLTESKELVTGDLVHIRGYNEFPLRQGDNFELQWSAQPEWREENGRRCNAGATSDKTAWLFGDSFSEALKPYLAATFKEIKFFRRGEDIKETLDSQKSKPNLIILEVVERKFGD